VRLSRIPRPGPSQDEADPVPGEELLSIEGLKVAFDDGSRRTQALRGVDLNLHAGEIHGVAGESGSGKTTVALTTMGLLPRGTHVEGSVRYRGTELLNISERQLRRFRGRRVAMIFQETSTALNPVMTAGHQLMMAARTHLPGTRAEARDRVRAALRDVRLRDTERVMSSYPHELSGGMCQRIMIAMALSCGSRVLLADEPTTALDVSVQAEVLDLVKGLVASRHLGVLMISHDLAVLAQVADNITVMYQGEVVESGPGDVVLRQPAHPYTVGLLSCLPRLHGRRGDLPELPPVGEVTEGGCQYQPRCALASLECRQAPNLASVADGGDRLARCWKSTSVLAASKRGSGGLPRVPPATRATEPSLNGAVSLENESNP